MRFIGIDLGASFIKGAVLDLDGGEIREFRRTPFPPFLAGLPAGFREVDCAQILRRTREELDRLLAAAPDAAGLVFSSQMFGVLLLDESGHPVSNFISWQDQRGLRPHPSAAGSYLDFLSSRLNPKEQRELGRRIRPGLPLSSLLWLKENGRLPPRAIPASLPELVLSQLTGSPVATAPTLASGLGGFSLASGGWHHAALERVGLAGLLWPKLAEPGETIGVWRVDGRRIPCYAGLGDHPCAMLGVGLEERELSINIATGSQASLVSDDWRRGEAEASPYVDGSFLRAVTHLPAGRALNVLVRMMEDIARALGFPLDDPWPIIEREATAVSPAGLRVDLSFSGSGAIEGISEENLSAGSLFRAAFDRMAENYCDAAQSLSPFHHWDRIVFSGGLALRSPILRRLITERLRTPCRVSGSSEDVLSGLLAVSLFSVGKARSLRGAAASLQKRSAASRRNA